MTQRFDKQVAVVTGAAQGIGRRVVERLLGEGALVVAVDRSALVEELHALTDVPDLSQRLLTLTGDMEQQPDCARVMAEAVRRFGRLDVLVNNAGTGLALPISELTPAQWLRVIDTNLNGPFLLARHAAAHMRQAGGGHIINVACTAAKRAWPNASACHASKWGLLGLSHALHAELRPYNIKVTAVIAGGMRTASLLERCPALDIDTLQDPRNVAEAIRAVLLLPEGSAVAEITVLPLQETSLP